MDADHCGRWTKNFGSKGFEPNTSRPVKNVQFLPIPPAFGTSAGGDKIGILSKSLTSKN